MPKPWRQLTWLKPIADRLGRSAIEPQTVKPQTIEPQTIKPQTVKPQTVKPQTIEPQTIELQTTELQTTELQMRSQFRLLRWRLLLSYLAAMIMVFGLAMFAAYRFFAYSLYQRLDQQLITLADAAAHSLPAMVTNRSALDQLLLPDDDGDLDLPWQNLRSIDQSIEWFDVERHLISKVGRSPVQQPPLPRWQFKWQGQIRVLTMPVYAKTGNTQQLWGYVRVSESAHEEAEHLHKLLTGLGLGGLVGIVLIGTTGWWLTQRSLLPIAQTMQQLKQFTADASHELRSPLTAIKTAVEVMQSHPERIDPADVGKVEAIFSATQQMTQLVEDLLLLARAEGVAALATQRIPLDELLEDQVALLEAQAQAKTVQLQLQPVATVVIRGDASQLSRLLTNLIENALQYTPAGGTVTIETQRLVRTVLIQVRDTGIGIAAEQLPYVFDRFWRADQARHYREGGSGLGLAIAQTIAQRHNGTITVSSQVGVGSCFQVELPIA